MSIQVAYQKLDARAVLPRYATPYAAGADLFALLDEAVSVLPGQTLLIRTGIALALPAGTVGLIYARSGLACKKGLAPANKVGVIDSDYRGELLVALHNHASEAVTVAPGDRIAQLVITPYLTAEFQEVEALDDTVRGEGGFGSTGG